MKKYILILLLKLCILTVYSQYESINCVILIDGQLPINTLSGQVIYEDKAVDFISIPGQILIESKEMKDIEVLCDTITVTVNINHTEFYKHQQRKQFNYTTKLPISLLRQQNEYIVFNITNINKKKSIYYFDYISSSGVKKWQWRKEYGKRKKAYEKIRKVVPDIYRIW